MNGQKNTNYTAADIERYCNGSMTSAERHALEKAALDDPFLADALDGYAAVPVVQSEDISLLEKKLDQRIHEKRSGKIVPLHPSNRTWLRIAALVILIAGAGLVTYQYVLKGKTKEVATTQNENIREKASPPTADTSITEPVVPADKQETTTKQKLNNAATTKIAETTKQFSAVKKDKTTARKDSSVDNKEEENSQLNEVVSSASRSPEHKAAAPTEPVKKYEAASARTLNKKKDAGKEADGIKDGNAKPKSILREETGAAYDTKNSSPDNAANIFKGRVLDENNSPLPFANITNIQDHVGTYTDVKGNFVLVSPDSTLNVQVRSVGFEDNISKLKSNIPGNTVVLQQDTKNIASAIINSRKPNTDRKRQDPTIVEEPEPSDGWYNYDTYLANNITIPNEIKTKRTLPGDVELSFSIDKYGAPVDITVEKSVCKECDAEAIRLLKEGPKWKKKKKNIRAKVAVAF